MPLFQFYLANFKITETRSHHNDTLIAGLGMVVNGTIAGIQVAQMGDFNNGTFEPWQHKLNAINNVLANPDDKISFIYEIYNNGHTHIPNEATLEEALTRDLSALQADIKSFGGEAPTSFDFPSPGYYSGDANSADFFTGGLAELFRDCDGIVAGYAKSLKGNDLETSVVNGAGGILKVTNTFNAFANGYGLPCNSSGSNYLVTWIIQHQP